MKISHPVSLVLSVGIVQCVKPTQEIQMIYAQTWRHRMGTGKSSQTFASEIFLINFSYYSFYLMVSAYSSYTNLLLQIYGSNVNTVELAPTPTLGPTTTPYPGSGGGNATG